MEAAASAARGKTAGDRHHRRPFLWHCVLRSHRRGFINVAIGTASPCRFVVPVRRRTFLNLLERKQITDP